MSRAWIVLGVMAVVLPVFAGIVPNPGFEDVAGGKLVGWTLDNNALPETGSVTTKQGVTVSSDASSVGTGKRCLKMTGSGRAEGDYALVGSPSLRLLPGFTYEISLAYRAEGLLPESGDRKRYTALIMDLFCNGDKGRIDGCRIITFTNSRGWVTLKKTFIPPPGTTWSQIRLQFVNNNPNSTAAIWWDNLAIQPLDFTLANTGFEQAEVAWKPVGAAKTAWVRDGARTGKYAVSVSDAPDGLFSGWATEIPVREDRAYRFGGFIKGGDLAPNGFIGGGALAVQFLDAAGQALGKLITSPAVPAKTEWTEVKTPRAQPPAGAVSARLTAGLQYCRGTAWFDDLNLIADIAEAANAARVQRDVPRPSDGVRYATNLLKNGDVETGAQGKPQGWTYIGSAEPNWTPEEITRLHTDGRPQYNIGRGRGEWSREIAYAGGGALLNISIDPPLSPNHQWYGRTPVDAYWLSDPMPCAPGKAYLAGCWLRPGERIGEAWWGPLELRFYDARGKQLAPASYIRCAISEAPAGEWSYWATMPYVAPAEAATMRLRFGQEFKADVGGWGRTYADNLAVWELPEGATVTKVEDVGLHTQRYREWFRAAHAQVKPPYQPSPAESGEYESCWGKMVNAVTGSLYKDPAAPVEVRFTLTNILGEARRLSLRITRTDWLGNADPPIVVQPEVVKGFSDTTVSVKLPPSRGFGTFHLDVEIHEGPAIMGRFTGRYAVMPPLTRPRTAENIWGVTLLSAVHADGRPFENEMGAMLQTAGFGLAWVRIHFSLNPAQRDKAIAETLKVVEWYRALGLRPILQLSPEWKRPAVKAEYEAAGKVIGTAFKGKVVAYGNHGVEQANSTSPYRGGGKDRLTDEEYDTILAGIYDGIKAVDPASTVLIGNISTDWEAKTVRRLYGPPANGRFDGTILNAYLGQVMTARNNLREFDKHGDTGKTVWMEEQAEQRSPFEGEARRYGEADGAKNMVRTWLALAGTLSPRIKAVTQWGFVGNSEADIVMVTTNLQPRPQFVAHAVMADALADARFIGDRSGGDVSIFEWKRGDGPFFAVWANAGERDLTLEVPAGKLTVMDLMGNRTALTASKKLLTLHVTSTPVYLFGGGAVSISKRLELRLSHGDLQAGKPQLRLSIKNNDRAAVSGKATFQGEIAGEAIRPFSLKPGETTVMVVPVKPGLPTGKQTPFRVECRTAGGALYAAATSLNFAQATRVAAPPALDGSWRGWESARVIPFGEAWQVVPTSVPDEKYTGPGDISGKLRLLWDARFLYLGVEALDDAFVPQPARGMSGFMGDSIEFGLQPAGLRAPTAPYFEYELYLPDGQPPYAASHRFPLPAGSVDKWQAAVTPTGTRGNVNYQAAIPWADLGLGAPAPGNVFTLAVVLNDADVPDRLSGGRCRIRWFEGVDNAKNPEGFGDVTLVEP
ncbi:MAG: sugar-binding protein [Armatimonadota bacterium]